MVDNIKTAVIIAGGEGTRLAPLTKNKPKTMIEVNGKPIIYWIIRWLKKYGITHVVIGVSYKKEKIYEYMKKNKNFGLNVNFSEHTINGGTAEGFGFAIRKFVNDKNFIAMNGDELTNMDLNELKKVHKQHNPLVTMALSPFPCRFSVVKLNSSKLITAFEYGKKLKTIPISIGIYVFNRNILKYIPKNGSIEDFTFVNLVKTRKIRGNMISDNEEWISINTLKDIKEAEKKPHRWMKI